MSERAEELARRFERRLAGVLAFAEGLKESELRAVVPGDGRALNVVLYHVAVAFSFDRRFFRAVRDGEWQPFTTDWADAANAAADPGHEHADQAEILDQLRGRGDKLAESIRALSDEDLDREVEFRAGAKPLSLAQLIDDEVLGHIEEHLGALVPA